MTMHPKPTTGNTIALRFPLLRTHCGLPLGNGLFGVLVWGCGSQLNLTVNRADFWDHRAGELTPGPQLYKELKARYLPDDPLPMDELFEPVGRARPPGDFYNTRLPMGRFEIQLAAGHELQEGILELDAGVLNLVVASPQESRTIRLAVHPDRCALLLEDPTGLVERVTPRPAWEWVSATLTTRSFHAPVVARELNHCGWAQACPGDPAMATWCERFEKRLIVTMSPGRDEAEATAAARELARRCATIGAPEFFRETAAWWNAYSFSLPLVRLPDSSFDRLYRLALYKFGAATNPLGGTACALQGPWCEEYQMPPWSGDYHLNVNIQQIYTLAFSAGKSSHLLPLFDMLERNADLFRLQAERVVGIADGLLITHTTDDRGYACGGVGPAACIDHAVSGWVAQLYWLYFTHTGDLEFLRQRALPFMIGVMRVYEEMLEWRDGIPLLPIGISAEYGRQLAGGGKQRVGPNPSSQLACIHMLTDALISASERLQRDPEPVWLEIRKKLPPWTVVHSDAPRIAVWEDQDLDISHRHHSHLSAVYPFDTVAAASDTDREILARSLHHWIDVGMSDWSEWGLPWAAIIQARSGYREGPRLLLKIFEDVFTNEGLASVYIPRFPGFTNHALGRGKGDLSTHEIMQLDGTMGFATAIHEMLVHSSGGVIRFFPAVPRSWPDLEFADIRLPGQLCAGGVMRNGKVTMVRLTAKAEARIVVDIPGYSALSHTRNGGVLEQKLPATIHLAAGETVEALAIP